MGLNIQLWTSTSSQCFDGVEWKARKHPSGTGPAPQTSSGNGHLSDFDGDSGVSFRHMAQLRKVNTRVVQLVQPVVNPYSKPTETINPIQSLISS